MALYFSLFAYKKNWIKIVVVFDLLLAKYLSPLRLAETSRLFMNTHTYLKEEARDQAGDVSIWRSCPIHVSVRLALADTGCT